MFRVSTLLLLAGSDLYSAVVLQGRCAFAVVLFNSLSFTDFNWPKRGFL